MDAANPPLKSPSLAPLAELAASNPLESLAALATVVGIDLPAPSAAPAAAAPEPPGPSLAAAASGSGSEAEADTTEDVRTAAAERASPAPGLEDGGDGALELAGALLLLKEGAQESEPESTPDPEDTAELGRGRRKIVKPVREDFHEMIKPVRLRQGQPPSLRSSKPWELRKDVQNSAAAAAAATARPSAPFDMPLPATLPPLPLLSGTLPPLPVLSGGALPPLPIHAASAARAAALNMFATSLLAPLSQPPPPPPPPARARKPPPFDPHDSVSNMIGGKARKNKKSRSREQIARQCVHCGEKRTAQWRSGPKEWGDAADRALCNCCGVGYRAGRIVPQQRFDSWAMIRSGRSGKRPPTILSLVELPPGADPRPSEPPPEEEEDPSEGGQAGQAAERAAPEDMDVDDSEGGAAAAAYAGGSRRPLDQAGAAAAPGPGSPGATSLQQQVAQKKRLDNAALRKGNVSMKASQLDADRQCVHCGETHTTAWLPGPGEWGEAADGALCNACGMAYLARRIVPQQRFKSDPTADPSSGGERPPGPLSMMERPSGGLPEADLDLEDAGAAAAAAYMAGWRLAAQSAPQPQAVPLYRSRRKAIREIPRQCVNCGQRKSAQWRSGPKEWGDAADRALCNTCGVAFRAGRLIPRQRFESGAPVSTSGRGGKRPRTLLSLLDVTSGADHRRSGPRTEEDEDEEEEEPAESPHLEGGRGRAAVKAEDRDGDGSPSGAAGGAAERAAGPAAASVAGSRLAAQAGAAPGPTASPSAFVMPEDMSVTEDGEIIPSVQRALWDETLPPGERLAIGHKVRSDRRRLKLAKEAAGLAQAAPPAFSPLEPPAPLVQLLAPLPQLQLAMGGTRPPVPLPVPQMPAAADPRPSGPPPEEDGQAAARAAPDGTDGDDTEDGAAAAYPWRRSPGLFFLRSEDRRRFMMDREAARARAQEGAAPPALSSFEPPAPAP